MKTKLKELKRAALVYKLAVVDGYCPSERSKACDLANELGIDATLIDQALLDRYSGYSYNELAGRIADDLFDLEVK